MLNAVRIISLCSLATLGPMPINAQDATDAQRITNPSMPTSVAPLEIADAARVIIQTSSQGQYVLANVTDAVRLSDSSMVIASAGTQELLFFDARGRHIRTLGGTGDGPGEYRWIADITTGYRDSLYVFDSNLQRLTVYSGRREVVRTARVEPLGRLLSNVRRLADGRWYAREQNRVRPGRVGSLNRDTVSYVLYTADMKPIRVVSSLPGVMGASFRGVMGEGAMFKAPFTPSPTHSEWGDCFYVAPGEGHDVLVFASSGRLAAKIENPWPRADVDDDSFDAWLNARVAAVDPRARSVLRTTLSRVPLPEHLPGASNIQVDALGFIWLSRYDAPDGASSSWTIFSPDGTSIGVVSFPEPIILTDIGSAYALGITKSDFGEDEVQVFALQRSGGDSYHSLGPCTLSG